MMIKVATREEIKNLGSEYNFYCEGDYREAGISEWSGLPFYDKSYFAFSTFEEGFEFAKNEFCPYGNLKPAVCRIERA